MLILLCSPVVISYALYFSGYKPDSNNYGGILPIVKMRGTGTNVVDNTIFRMKDLHGKWVLVNIDSGVCEEDCRKKMYFMRQVRLVQGKEMNRIERLWLINNDTAPNEQLLKDYEGTFFINASNSELLSLIETHAVHTKHIYLIDPLGNLMMRFPEIIDGKKMSQDLKRLLQVSQIEH